MKKLYMGQKMIVSALAGMILIPGSVVRIQAAENEEQQSVVPTAGIESALEECYRTKVKENLQLYLVPTADTVYMHVKKEFPNISLGTVYRNLNLLTDIGEAIKISTPDGGDRFDGTVQPHNHFLCTKCGRFLDLELDMKSIEEMNRLANDCFDGMITSSSTLFYGECSDCIRKS